MQFCEPRPWLPIPSTHSPHAGAWAGGRRSPLREAGSQCLAARHLLPTPGPGPLDLPSVYPRAWAGGGTAVLSFYFPRCPSAEPSSGHPDQSGGAGEECTTFTSKSFCLKQLQQNHPQRNSRYIEAVLQGGGPARWDQTAGAQCEFCFVPVCGSEPHHSCLSSGLLIPALSLSCHMQRVKNYQQECEVTE